MSQPVAEITKPVIGISSGDLNGIGMELIIKTVSDHRILELCTPVIFGSSKFINFYRKFSPEINFTYQVVKDFIKLAPKQVHLVNCWEEDVSIQPGQLTDVGGSYAVKSLIASAEALKEKKIHGLVTAPIHKKKVQSAEFDFTGHTPFLKHFFGARDVLMLMTAENMKVGLVTEHIPVGEIAKHITKEAILSKLQIMRDSLVKDFGIDKPKIAVLALNPHAGDEGLIGDEEKRIIGPAVAQFHSKGTAIVMGPYSADAFFARGSHEKFDAVLAMYHDQGLVPFKSLAFGEGTNYTAGLPVIRTSPDHGTAFDIAGKNRADPSSFIQAIFQCIDIARQRKEYDDYHSNPLKKVTAQIMANAVDERIQEEG